MLAIKRCAEELSATGEMFGDDILPLCVIYDPIFDLF